MIHMIPAGKRVKQQKLLPKPYLLRQHQHHHQHQSLLRQSQQYLFHEAKSEAVSVSEDHLLNQLVSTKP